MTSTESASYTKTAKTLHWLIALAIIFMLALGWSFDFLPKGSTKFFFIQLHKSIGITILLLSLIRLGWRLTHTAPLLPASIPLWQRRTANIVHVLLYIGMIGLPFTGWAMVSSSPRNLPTILFGIVQWPHLPILPTLDNKKEVSDAFFTMHSYGAYILAALVAGHIAAALKHHFIGRDDILLRMAPNCCAGILNYLRGQK